MKNPTIEKLAVLQAEPPAAVETGISSEIGDELRRIEQTEHKRQERLRTQELARSRALQTFD
jgi:hypothetical protein